MINVAVIFPNKKHGGIYALGPMYVELYFNLDKRFYAKRYFLDDLPKGKQHIYVFSVSYELDLPKVIKILKMLNVPLNPEKRKELVVAGGPAVKINPYYLKDIVDFELLGEAEVLIPQISDPLYDYFIIHQNKEKLLEEIKDIKGVFIPRIKEKEEYVYIENLDESIHPINQPLPKKLTRKYVFGRAFILEVCRSCPFNCYFCDVRFLYNKFRYRSLENLKEIIYRGLKINGKRKIALVSPTLLHPNLFDLLDYILSLNTKYMLPSLRAELLLQEKMLEYIKKSSQRSITLAPEVGSEELRFKINKRTPDWVFFEIAKKAKNYGIKELKFYFIVGLPYQDISDAYNIVEFLKKIKESFKGKIYASINPFVPKRGSVFENEKFDKEKAKKMMEILKENLPKLKIKFKFKSLRTAEREYKIQWERRRGDLNPGPAGINRPHPS